MTERLSLHALKGASQVMLVVKKTLAYTGDVRDGSSGLGLGRSPGGGHGNPLLYSCLENCMDRVAWQATVHGITKSWTHLREREMGTSLIQLPSASLPSKKGDGLTALVNSFQ